MIEMTEGIISKGWIVVNIGVVAMTERNMSEGWIVVTIR